jgi:hypothetical protein
MSRKEVARIHGLESLDAETRRVLKSELDSNYLIPSIQKVLEIRAHLGTLFWTVSTNAGPRRFALKDPCDNVMWLTEDRLVIRDCAGNRYEIESLDGMDRQSRNKISLVI